MKTTMPRRIQLLRKKGFRLPPNTVNVARPTMWGNPFRVGKARPRLDGVSPYQDIGSTALHDLTAAEAVQAFRKWLDTTEDGRFAKAAARKALRGKNLACWCKPGEPCHGDVWLEVANGLTNA